MLRLLDRPRMLGLICAAFAAAMGLVYLAVGGAPSHYLLINLAAFGLGAAIWLPLSPAVPERYSGVAILALALMLLATALFGVTVEGAARWVSLGPLSLQVSFIVLPALVVLYARKPGALGMAGILLAALALAAQPDRAMAGALLAGTAAVAMAGPGAARLVAPAGAGAAFVVTMLRPDALPAEPFVERVLHTAFDVHLLIGVAVLAGCVALVLPTLAAARTEGERPVLLAFGAVWASLIAAAAIGNYPTPVVGYGGSAVLGYLASVALLRGERRGRGQVP